MLRQEDNILDNLNQIFLYLINGEMDAANDLLDKIEPTLISETHTNEFIDNLRKFILQYKGGAVFLNAISNGNLAIPPPDDPHRENYVIAQYKQLHSNLNHLTWQTQQIAKGDLKQKVSFLGEFSIAFNKMIDALRDKKLMENQIKSQFEQLQKLNAEKDKFFSIIAHDLRSPLSGLMQLTEMMTEESVPFTPDQKKDMTLALSRSARNIFNLLENLLEWSRMQQGLIPFKPQLVTLLTIVDESLSIVIDSAKNKEIDIAKHFQEDLVVFADRKMLQTIIRNLVSNAVKFTPKGGKINITAKATKEDGVQISIIDSGIGMNLTLIDNLFRLDVQTNRKGTDGEASTGLGLLLCKEFVEKHGGKFWAESEEGKGSTFNFTLPLLKNTAV